MFWSPASAGSSGPDTLRPVTRLRAAEKMGGWKLELFRMTLYISFPVGMFLLFNYPPFYEQAIMEGRRALASSYDPEAAELLRQFMEKKKAEQMERTMKELREGRKEE